MRRRLPAALALVALLAPALAGVAPTARAAVEDRPLAPLVLVEEGRTTPLTRFDGVETVGPGASSSDTFQRMQQALVARQNTGTPFHARLDVRLEPGVLVATATYSQVGAAPDALRFRFALALEGAPGELRRFVLLERAENATAAAEEDGARSAEARFALQPQHDRDRLAIVAWVEAAEAHGRHRAGEALQAALWTAGQDGPTIQTRKSVLLEHATADECAACAQADEAVALLLTQNRLPAESGEAGSYAVRPGALAIAGLLGGGAIGAGMMYRQRDGRGRRR